MQNLQQGTILQNGKYKIIEMLGQGGFGITYLAMQSGLERKVAIKEFFMKEVCERDPETSHVTLGTEGGRETVLRYREKFMKEARNIAKLSHKNIVRIIDVFEENNTSYYVMEYVENGSLEGKVNREGYLSEPVATRYILQVADALDYIHQQNMSHLDVKPANIMLNAKDETVLIDFGLSKQYDAATGNQTSSTPVGISEGFAPMEQYKKGGVGEFSPKTDIYSLGATFFCLLTGVRPPSASDVFEDGLPIEKLKARGVSQKAIDIICKAMEGRKKDRLDDVAAFIKGLKQDAGEDTSAKMNNQKEDGAKNDEDGDTLLKSPKKKAEQETGKSKTRKWKTRAKKILVNNVITSTIAKVLAIIKKIGFKKCAITAVLVAFLALIINNVLYLTDQVYYFNPIIKKSHAVSLNDIMSDMIYVEGGTFTMGPTPKEQEDLDDWKIEEQSPHQVTLSSYYIGKYEVTQDLWMAVMGDNPSRFKGNTRPIENVSWNDCQTFLRKLNSITGKTFRLPTEAEWEYAARGGNRSCGYQYSGSNVLGDVAWYWDNSGSKTHPVGTKAPNELGIYDMTGNVCEWCQDWYGDYSSSAQTNPTGPSSGSCRVTRGGSWDFGTWGCRIAYRVKGRPGRGSDDRGLRLALSQ